jgi:homocysteine S-methyltransferase
VSEAAPSVNEMTLLDGATGTELSRRGADTGLPLWSARPLVEEPELVVAVHREYLQVGCKVLTACTFRTHARSLRAGGWDGRQDELNQRALELAQKARQQEGREGVRIAGSISPLEDCYSPVLVPSTT